jgi:hypothetical protein
MKRSKALYVLGFIIILALFASACAKSDSKSSANMVSEDRDDSYDNGATAPQAGADYDTKPAVEGEYTEADSQEALGSTSSLSTGEAALQTQDKIIRRFLLDVETQEFDSLITRIDSEIKALGGYVESSEISGKRYYDREGARYGRIIARIPVDKVNEFVNEVDENANVVNKEESSDNVSLKYIDAESRVETLKIEQERLYVILEQEASLENIITLESRLSDIRYELQNYESQLRYYDNQVTYSTVTLSIQEVEKLTPVAETKQTVGDRIKNGFSDTMYKLSEGLKDFFVWFVVNLPYLLIWAVIIAAALFLIRRSLKKRRKGAVMPPMPPINLNDTGFNGQNQDQDKH